MRDLKNINRTREREKARHSKQLYDLVVEYVYYRSKAKTKEEKKTLFETYNDTWFDHCFSNKNNKLVALNFSGFRNIVKSCKKLNSYQRVLGLPVEKFTIWQRLFGI